MASIAEWLVLRKAAAAKRNGGPAGYVEILALGILDHKVSGNSQWSVRGAGY